MGFEPPFGYIQKTKEVIDFRKSKDESVSHIVDVSKTYLSNEQIKFFKSQLRNSRRKRSGRHWTVSDKLLAERIKYHSTQAYKRLGSIFCLPLCKTVTKFVTIDNSVWKDSQRFQLSDTESVEASSRCHALP